MSLHIATCLASHLNASLLDATMSQPLLLPSLVFKALKTWGIANTPSAQYYTCLIMLLLSVFHTLPHSCAREAGPVNML